MKVGIVTIFDLGNYGNRLQNYAVQKTVESVLGVTPKTLKNKNVTKRFKLADTDMDLENYNHVGRLVATQRNCESG